MQEARKARKSQATAGVAIVGASLIAATPVVAAPQHITLTRDVALTAGGSGLADIVGPYTSVFNQAQDNLSTLLNAHYLAPNIGFQQALHNFSGYIQQILDDPNSIPAMTNELQQDVKRVLSSLTLMNADQDTINDVIRHTMDSSYLVGNLSGGHEVIFGQIPGFLPADQADSITPIINYLASPMSAVLIGSLGPWIAPGVALSQSLEDFVTNLKDGDSSAALQDLANIPAGMFNASLNGATLNLDSLLPAINDAGLFPEGMSLTHLDFAFGGLLSTGGHVTSGPIHVDGPDGKEIALVPGVGGSIFNSIGLTIDGAPVVGTLDAPSDAVGPIGAWLGLSQVIASQLGWGSWSGKTPEFSVPIVPPGIDIHLPTLPGDFFDDGGASGSAAAEGSSAALQALLDGFGA